MAIGCGANCAKLIILSINFVFMIIGIVLAGFGVFLVIDTKALHNHIIPIGASAELMIGAAIVILIVGLIIFFITIIGCCATSKEHTGCLTFYSIILIFLLLLQIVAVILAGVFYNKIISSLDDEMTKIVKTQYGQPEYNDSTTFIDTLQTDLKCCGVTSKGPLDWEDSYWKKTAPLNQNVPDSCCTKDGNKIIDHDKCQSTAYKPDATGRDKYVYIEGCDNKLDQLIKHYVGVLVGVVIGVVIIQIVFIVATCVLKSSISRGYEYV